MRWYVCLPVNSAVYTSSVWQPSDRWATWITRTAVSVRPGVRVISGAVPPYGSAMNPRDHPHGGGEGRSPIGGQPQTPWGKPALGYKTRKNKRTDHFIVRRRNAGRRRK